MENKRKTNISSTLFLLRRRSSCDLMKKSFAHVVLLITAGKPSWLSPSTKASPSRALSTLSVFYLRSLVTIFVPCEDDSVDCTAFSLLNIIIILYIDMKRIISLLFIPIYKHVQDIHACHPSRSRTGSEQNNPTIKAIISQFFSCRLFLKFFLLCKSESNKKRRWWCRKFKVIKWLYKKAIFLRFSLFHIGRYARELFDKKKATNKY